MKPLIICSNALFCEGLIRWVQKTDAAAEVTVAASFSQALHLIKQNTFSAVLLTAELRDINLWTAVDVLGAQPHCPPLTLLAPAERTDIARAQTAGFSGFIPLHTDAKILQQALKKVLNGDSYFPPAALLGAAEKTVAAPSGRLTPRQKDVLAQIENGKSNKEIARALRLAEGTIKIHCMAIFRELGVSNRTQAALRAGQLLR